MSCAPADAAKHSRNGRPAFQEIGRNSTPIGNENGIWICNTTAGVAGLIKKNGVPSTIDDGACDFAAAGINVLADLGDGKGWRAVIVDVYP